jgi:hypothetical protein
VALAVQLLALAIVMWRIGSLAKRGRALTVVALLAALVFAIGVGTAATFNRGEMPPLIEATLAKWSALNPNVINFNYDNATSGRFIETTDALRAFNERPLRWITGTGYGWSFDWAGNEHHYVHFSPINFVFQYGILFAVLFFGILCFRLFRAFWSVTASTPPAKLGMVLLCIGTLTEGLFAYMYAVNPWIWVGLGIVAGQQRQENSIRRMAANRGTVARTMQAATPQFSATPGRFPPPARSG